MAQIVNLNKRQLNKSEQKVADYLEENLPDEDYTIYTGVLLPGRTHQPECEIVVVAPHAVYAIEVKNAGGVISIEGDKWSTADGFTFFNKNPLNQVKVFVDNLRPNLNRYNAQLERVYVQGIVCFAQEDVLLQMVQRNGNRITIDTSDPDGGYANVREYRQTPEYLTNPLKYGLFRRNILHLHELIAKAFYDSFFVPTKVGDYRITGGAWFTDTCCAYYSKQKPSPNLLIVKTHRISEDLNDSQREDLITEIKRDADALIQLGEEDGGASNFIAPKLIDQFLDPEHGYVIVTEWVEGLMSIEQINKTWMIGFRKKYDLAYHLCKGLAFVHRHNVVHRNLHPGNLIYNDSGMVRLVNFDYARFTGSGEKGTLRLSDPKMLFEYRKWERYRAPELSSTPDSYHDATPESDKYSLGVILWELFTQGNPEPNQPVDFTKLTQVAGLHPGIPPMIEALCAQDTAQRAQVDLEALAQQLTVILNQKDNLGFSVPVLEDGEMFLNKYRNEQILAETLFSRAYRAVDPHSGQRVVIKFLSAQWDKARKEIERASKILKDLDGSYTARWINGGYVPVKYDRIVPPSTEGSFKVGYEIIEFIEGINLKQIVNEGGCDGETALRIGELLLEALVAVHAAGWMHKDIKPDNLILTPEGYVKIIDFGMARRIEAPLSSEGFTYGYTPPNVLPKEGVTEDADWQECDDVYSAAATIMALMCGERRSSYGGPVLDWDIVREETNGAVVDLLKEQLDPEPAKRCQTAEALRLKLEEALENLEAVREQEQQEDEVFEAQGLAEAVQDVIAKLNEMGAQDLRSIATVKIGGQKLGDADRLKRWLNEGLPGDCPVNISLYGLSLPGVTVAAAALAAATQPPDEDETEDEETKQRKRRERVDSLIRQVRDALEKNDLMQAETLLNLVFNDEPENEEAQKLNAQILLRKEQERIDQLIARLTNESDIGSLDRAVTEARELLANLREKKVESNQLQAAFDENYKRYQDIKTTQQAGSTNIQIGNYEQVLAALRVIEQAMAAGDQTRFTRTGEIVPIQQLADEARSQLALEVLPVLAKHFERARDAMPTGRGVSRTPALALEEINQALKLEGLGEMERILQAPPGQDPTKALLEGREAVLKKLNNSRLLDLLKNTLIDALVAQGAGEAAQLEKQLEQQGVAASPRLLLEALRDEYQRQFNAWQLAGKELETARGETRAMTKLRRWKQGYDIYPYHSDLQAYRPTVYRLAVSFLVKGVGEAVQRAQEHLGKEAQEAMQVALTGGGLAEMKTFERAVGELNALREEAEGIEEEDSTSSLANALRRLDDCEQTVLQRKERREQIFWYYNQVMQALNEKNVTRANEIYLTLDVDYKNDKLIELLEPRVRGSLTDDQHLEEAAKYLQARSWQKCIDECAEIKDAGMKDRADRLRQMAEIELLRETILTYWQSQYYEQCYDPIERLAQWSTNFEDVRARQAQISSELALEGEGGKRAQIQRMREANEQSDALRRMDEITEAVPELRDRESQIGVLGENDSRLERVLLARGWIVELVMLPLTYKGQLRDWQRRLDGALRQQLLRDLDAMHTEQTPNLDRAFRFAQALRKNGLLLESYQVELCRWALVAYYEKKNEALRVRGDWPAIIQNAEHVAKAYKDEYALRESLIKYRHEYLLIVLDETLHNLDVSRAERILLHEENPCVFDNEIPYRYNVETDPELQERQGTLKTLTDAGIFEGHQNYEEAIVYLNKQLEENKNKPEETRQRRQKVYERKIESIRQKGAALLKAVGEDATKTMAERAYAYARILVLLPEDVTARTWLNDNNGTVRYEIKTKVEEGQELEITSQHVQDQLNQAEQLQRDLHAFQSACDILDWISKTDVEQALRQVESVLNELRSAHRQLEFFGPQGSMWLGCLGTGDFVPCEEAVQKLEAVLNLPNMVHEQVSELEDRLYEGRNDRESVKEALSLLKTKYAAEDFGSAIAQCKRINDTLRRYGVVEPGTDPFRLVKLDESLWDTLLTRQVFYYPREGKHGTECILSVLEARRENLNAWNAYLNCINEERARLGNYPVVDREAATLAMKEGVEKYLLVIFRHNKQLYFAELAKLQGLPEHEVDSLPIDQSWLIPTPQLANSNCAQQVSEQANRDLRAFQNSIETARRDWVVLHAIDNQKRAELDDLLPGYSPSPENFRRVRDLSDYFAESKEEELIDFIEHLKRLAGSMSSGERPNRRR